MAALTADISLRVYIEPAAGSAAVLFRKPRAPVEIINDIDGAVVNFFRVPRDRPAELARACRLTPYARGQYLADAEDEPDAGDLERARRFWARCTQSFNSGGAGGGPDGRSLPPRGPTRRGRRLAGLPSWRRSLDGCPASTSRTPTPWT